MHFSSINFLGVLAAGIVGFVVNFGWFGPLKMYDRWNKALGRTEPLKPEDMPPAPQLFGLTLLSVFVEAATIAAGIAPGDRVVLVSENRPAWAISDLAIMSIGSITVPVSGGASMAAWRTDEPSRFLQP